MAITQLAPHLALCFEQISVMGFEPRFGFLFCPLLLVLLVLIDFNYIYASVATNWLKIDLIEYYLCFK